MSIPIGAGGIVSTASDVTTFMEALFTGKIISAQSIEKNEKLLKEVLEWGFLGFLINDREKALDIVVP